MLWFVHMLAVFYVVTRLVARLPKWMVLLAAAALQVAHQALWIDTPSFIANRFMDYYVFFFLGYAIADIVFDVAERAKARPWVTLGVLAGWAVGNEWLTRDGPAPPAGLRPADGPRRRARHRRDRSAAVEWKSARFLRYCGQNSIVIYLTFFFPMTILERILASKQVIPDVGWACFAILVDLGRPAAALPPRHQAHAADRAVRQAENVPAR